MESLLSLPMISKLVLSNPFDSQTNWQMIQSRDKNKLVDFLKHHTIIDEVKNEMKIESFQANKELVV
jgi:hypothetical protein